MLELIISLIVLAALVFCYRIVRTRIDSKMLQGLLCMVIAIAIVVTVIYAGMSLIIIFIA